MTGPDEHPPDEASVLSSLPATRPQRRSPKRAASKPDVTGPSEATRTTRDTQTTTPRPRPPQARRPAAGSEPAEPNPLEPPPPARAASTGDPERKQTRRATGDPVSKQTRRATGDPVSKQTRRAAGDPPTPPAAAQGFDANPIHDSVSPPTGAELLASVAQGLTELVEIGLALTRRLAHSVLDRLPDL